MFQNNNCDGSRPHTAGAVRVLPTGGGGNSILCFACYRREMAFRVSRNRDLSGICAFDLPTWESLKLYEVGVDYQDVDVPEVS